MFVSDINICVVSLSIQREFPKIAFLYPHNMFTVSLLLLPYLLLGCPCSLLYSVSGIGKKGELFQMPHCIHKHVGV